MPVPPEPPLNIADTEDDSQIAPAAGDGVIVRATGSATTLIVMVDVSAKLVHLSVALRL